MKYLRAQVDRRYTAKDVTVRKVIVAKNIVSASKWERNALIYASAKIAKMVQLLLLPWIPMLILSSLLTVILIHHILEVILSSLIVIIHLNDMALTDNNGVILFINRKMQSIQKVIEKVILWIMKILTHNLIQFQNLAIEKPK